MKKNILTLLTLAATAFGCGSLMAASSGDIYDVHACDEAGASIAKAKMPLYSAEKPMVAGQKAYFKLRLLPRLEGAFYSTNKWSFVYTGLGGEVTGSVLPPQIGVFVSGQLRYATYIGKIDTPFNASGASFTDLVFEYDTKPGDFALPIVLAANSGGNPVPASDYRENISSYYFNPLRSSEWELRFKMYDDSVVTADCWVMQQAPVPLGTPVERVQDVSLAKAGYFVRTLDFASNWEEEGTLWRSVHQDSTITVGTTPQIVAKSASDEAVTLYLWSTNEAAVVLAGPDVREVEMPDPADVSKTKTYHVAAVTLAAGQLSADFSIRGVDRAAGGGKSALVLSAYDHFNVSDADADLIKDFLTVPVKCIEPLPPSVIVELDRGTAYATSDYKRYAARMTVKLSQAIATPFKVKITPQFSDGGSEPAWGEYVRFSTMDEVSALPDATIPEVTLGGDVMSADLFIYCLRGDSRTIGVNQIEFVPSSDEPPAEIEAWTKGGLNIAAQAPEITTPAEDDIFEAIQFDETPLPIAVEGSYADALSKDGYEVWVKYTSSTKFVKIDGKFMPGEDNFLFKLDDEGALTDEMPLLTYTSTSTYEKPILSQVYVKAPVSAKSSEYRNFKAVVSAARSSTVETKDGLDTYDEGVKGGVTFVITLSESTDQDLYAFLKPSDNIEDFGVFKGTTPFIIGMENCQGLRIPRGKTSASGAIQMLDGWDPDNGGFNFSVEVKLCDQKAYDPAHLVKGYDSETLDLTINNVEPEIKRIELNGVESEGPGYTYPNKFPKGQSQTLKAVIGDVSYDLEHDFECKWTPYLDNVAQTPTVIKGNPEDNPFIYDFPQAGLYTIRLQVRDKDMSDWAETDYRVNVEVLDNPGVEITTDENYMENDAKATISVNLSFYDAKEPLHVKLSVERYNTEVSGDYGELVFELEELTFNNANPQKVAIKRMDGTDLTDNYGWRIKAEVTDETVNPKTGDKWKDYYLPGESRIYVANVAPNDNDGRGDTFMPAANSETNRWTCSGVAVDHPITIKISKDVQLDFDAGITVQIIGADGAKYNKDGFVNGVKKVYAPETITYTPDFSGFEGDQQVTIIVSDKDGGTLSRTWYFSMAKSKTLTTIAHGPSGGNSAFSLSTKYEGAAGLGEGHVFSSGSFTSASAFWLNWNCGTGASALLYAFGYKVGDIDNGGLLPYDQAIDETGYAKSGETPGSAYAYPDKVYDSFLYTWILNATDDSGSSSSGYLGSVAPEKGDGKIISSEVQLPTEANEDGSYVKTTVEAIFSKEMYPADNMGDINQDGIPDLYVTKYYFDVIDPTSGQVTEGGKDLTSLKSYNADNDFLPIGYVADVWVTNVVPFTAELEIRGYGAGLNDATAEVFPDGVKNPYPIQGVKIERHYTDPDEDDKDDPRNASTLTKVEYCAWTMYAAEQGLDPADPANWNKWSPERPTNPTMEDTDEDGFDDGLEYWFWYRAHVGDPDTGKRLTGRRYNPRNPGEGDLITAKEIEDLFDPIKKCSSADQSQQRDTDNDGLPDLLEFWIGTNPLDFDSDHDGLPDGWEIMISGTDPQNDYTTAGTHDALRNYDGDAMAFTTPKLEATVYPKPRFIQKLISFAVIDADGDSDGIQWYVGKAGVEAGIEYEDETLNGWKFTAGGVDYVCAAEPKMTADGLLAADLPKTITFTLGDVGEFTGVRLMPTYIVAGTKLDGAPEEVEYHKLTLTSEFKPGDLNAAWVYGKAGTSNTGITFGMLTLGRYQEPASGAVLAAAPDPESKSDENIAYLHSFVYQEFGFDPRTAWNPNENTSARFSITEDGEIVEGVKVAGEGGYAAWTARTRAYTTYDEFLVYSFFLNNGVDMSGYTYAGDNAAPSMAKIWSAFTTNPQGPYEPDLNIDESELSDKDSGNKVKYYGRNNDNGCDTDGDGVPDGWELYVMAGPKTNKGQYVFAPPYMGFVAATGEFPESVFSPFVALAGSTETDNMNYLLITDGLNELREFSGTDSCAYYTEEIPSPDESDESKPRSSTILKREEQDGLKGLYVADDSKWLNKFFPTDPWNADTDGDGVKDGDEGKAFIYNDPVTDRPPADDGKIWSIPGGGLNPCTVDTDGDGLPDGWEKQFTLAVGEFGGKVYTYDGDIDILKPTYLKDEDGNEIGCPLEGLCNCMDGTVYDSCTWPRSYQASSTADDATQELHKIYASSKSHWGGQPRNGKVNRDYDRDGLENWQEYLVGAMRCWRYDDPLTPFTAIPDAAYYNDEGKFDPLHAAEYFGLEGADDEAKKAEFWYQTLVDVNSPIYNPRLVTDMSAGSMYFSRVNNGWDLAYCDPLQDAKRSGGAYYIFFHRIGETKIEELWGAKLKDVLTGDMNKGPTKYISCSPLESDTDHDGMDDYYELFHGLNPLLGVSGVKAGFTSGCDIVFDAWCGQKETALAAWGTGKTENYWQRNPWKEPRGENKYDFEVFPWLTGEAMADPDGDDIPNQTESIMARLSTATFHHSDPTPLWVTDTSYSNSLTRLSYRLPARFQVIELEGESFIHGEGEEAKEYFFRDYDCYLVGKTPSFGSFVPDSWGLAADGKYNWIASFEENEGYDTDHDGSSDYEESQGKIRSATDPIDFDSPIRRQAMYFPGKDAALQTMPFVREEYPVNDELYPDDISFKQYTVECWVKPESVADQTIVERAVWNRSTNPGDKEYLRCNFQLAIKNGKWYTKFDPQGTTVNPVFVLSASDVELGKWTHLAATYDCKDLILYVNGVAQVPVPSELTPEYGKGALALHQDDVTGVEGWGSEARFNYQPGDFAFARDYDYTAILVGASFKGKVDGGNPKPLDVTKGEGWGSYTNFFKGYVDEIRIWDGARDAGKIIDAMYKRATDDSDLAEKYPTVYLDVTGNRNTFYNQWIKGRRRYAKDENGEDYVMEPELRHHYSFDSVFAAADAESVAVAPRGFSMAGGKAIVSRPDGYEIAWWKRVLEGYGSVYAGDADYINWIPNTVTHMPRFDTTTLDSFYWSENFCGSTNGTFKFARSAEPVSLWVQYSRNACEANEYGTTAKRHHLVNETELVGTNSTAYAQFEFTGRHLNQSGDDLLPLGGAFVKYCEEMWDNNGASSTWELTGTDSDGNGLPDWWEEYVRQNESVELPPGVKLEWDTMIVYKGIEMSAGEAYRRDLASGLAVTKDEILENAFPQTADVDSSRIPDWWEDLYNITGESGSADTDNDGLNNRIEYLVSEVFPFSIKLNPRLAATDTKCLDYFRQVGKLYLGEMLTDHDMMEDHWERALADYDNVDPTLWDALWDGDEDGWNNFAENRYNGFAQATIANLVSHLVGDAEVLDAPTPSIKLTVRYNGKRKLSAAAGEDGKKEESDSSSGGNDGSSDINIGDASVAALVVEVMSDETAEKVDASYSLKPGQSVDKAVYLGGWEDRIVRGTMGPGHIDIGSVNLFFAHLPQSELYSWSDENGLHISRPYKEFKEALQRNPDIIQNVQEFKWMTLAAPVNAYASADKAVYVVRDSQQQRGHIIVYGERVGTIDLETGDYEFNMTAINELSPNYTFRDTRADAWGYKEAIFKLTYAATVPSVQQTVYQVSLARPDSGFVRGGRNTIVAYYDLDGDGYTPGTDPMGVVRDLEVGWSGATAEIELSEMNAITPRINLWKADESDRGARTDFAADPSNRYVNVFGGNPEEGASGGKGGSGGEGGGSAVPVESRIRVVRYQVDGFPVYEIGAPATVLFDRKFQQDVRSVINEGDFLSDDVFDIDWNLLEDEVVNSFGTQLAGCPVTNVNYIIAYGDGAVSYRADADTNTVVKAHPLMISRRFEVTHTPPTAIQDAVCNKARPTFRWKIENEDIWASWYGTTYTAFKIKVWNSAKKLVYDSGYQRMPACDSEGVYSWTAPLYADSPSPSSGIVFANLSNYTWKVYTYNAKFKTDDVGSAEKTFRMNVTELDESSCSFGACVRYSGPATSLEGKVLVQAFESPDFVGNPVAQASVADVTAKALSPTNGLVANAVLKGLNPGTYYVRAFIDTNGNGTREDWESWGYLCERDRGRVGGTKGIFNPVSVTVAFETAAPQLRCVYIEDCDTNRNWFPDVWEAEQNGNVFDPDKIPAVKGDAELIGVNPELKGTLNKSDLESVASAAMKSAFGVSALTGVSPDRVTAAPGGGYLVEPTADPDTVRISGFSVLPDERKVVLTVGAQTDGQIDGALAAALSVTVAKGALVTVKIYHKENLGDAWGEPILRQVRIGEEGTDIGVEFAEDLPATGHYSVAIEQTAD